MGQSGVSRLVPWSLHPIQPGRLPQWGAEPLGAALSRAGTRKVPRCGVAVSPVTAWCPRAGGSSTGQGWGSGLELGRGFWGLFSPPFHSCAGACGETPQSHGTHIHQPPPRHAGRFPAPFGDTLDPQPCCPQPLAAKVLRCPPGPQLPPPGCSCTFGAKTAPRPRPLMYQSSSQRARSCTRAQRVPGCTASPFPPPVYAGSHTVPRGVFLVESTGSRAPCYYLGAARAFWDSRGSYSFAHPAKV